MLKEKAMASSTSEATTSTSDATSSTWSQPPDFSSLSTYGWSWAPEFPVDANYLDLACLVARNSIAKDGHMGCVLVSGVAPGEGDALSSEAQVGRVELCTINSSLFGAHRSDCHAEANAVAHCAKTGLKVQGLSCYVTRAPCLACYKLLASAGIGRIVAPQPLDSPDCVASAAALGIECVALRDSDERAARRQGLGTSHEDMDRVRALREERKRLRKEKTFGKKALRVAAAAQAATMPGATAAPSEDVCAAAAAEDLDGDLVDADDSL